MTYFSIRYVQLNSGHFWLIQYSHVFLIRGRAHIASQEGVSQSCVQKKSFFKAQNRNIKQFNVLSLHDNSEQNKKAEILTCAPISVYRSVDSPFNPWRGGFVRSLGFLPFTQNICRQPKPKNSCRTFCCGCPYEEIKSSVTLSRAL